MIDDRPEDRLQQSQQRQGTAELAAQLGQEPSQPAASSTANTEAPLFPAESAANLRERWQEVQTSFVDEPRRAVEQADELVASAIKELATNFAEERSQLERQWDRGDEVSTEDLRLALQKYRSFFGRLLAV